MVRTGVLLSQITMGSVISMLLVRTFLPMVRRPSSYHYHNLIVAISSSFFSSPSCSLKFQTFLCKPTLRIRRPTQHSRLEVPAATGTKLQRIYVRDLLAANSVASRLQIIIINVVVHNKIGPHSSQQPVSRASCCSSIIT